MGAPVPMMAQFFSLPGKSDATAVINRTGWTAIKNRATGLIGSQFGNGMHTNNKYNLILFV